MITPSCLARLLIVTILVTASALDAAAQGVHSRPPRNSTSKTSDLASRPTDPAAVALVSEIHSTPGAAWIRVRFGNVQFGPDGQSGYLRVTSLLDHAVQILDAVSLPQWHGHSAYFNGESVLIEFMAPPTLTDYAVTVEELLAGYPDPADEVDPRSLCGSQDDRVISFDPRAARVVGSNGTSIGTAFIINDATHSFLTSGQTAGLLTTTAVIQFNAPLTYPNGTTLNHPPPSDQYTFDSSSIQSGTGGIGSGNNWGYFGCLPNSTTGLRPYEAQGAAFDIADIVPAPSGQTLEYFGFGAVVPPLFRTWSYVQKTTTGEYASLSGSRLTAVIDATNGDSGAPLINLADGKVFAILYEDGCTASGGANGATAVTNLNLRNAMSRPFGVTRPFDFLPVNGIPELFSNAGDATILVEVVELNGVTAAPETGKLHYRTGTGWNELPLELISPNIYAAHFPAFPCGTLVDYFFSIQSADGIRFPNPAYPPDLYRSAAASSMSVLAAFDFELVDGWTVENVNVTGGAWERGIPAGNGTRGDPTTDFDGSGSCWLTGNAPGDSDVDGGPTRLRSPSFNLLNTNHAFLSFAGWFTNDTLDEDRLVVQASTNGGLTYTNILAIENGVGWREFRIKISDFISLAGNNRFRFSVADNPNNSRTEAAVDAFSIIDFQCSTISCLKGDVNADSLIDGRDVSAFATALISGATPGSQPHCASDIDSDGTLELGDDLQAFVQCLLSGACP